jgi:hypothetical protein
MDPKHKDVKSVAEADEIEALFVQTSHGMSYEDGKLTLQTLAPTTLFFSGQLRVQPAQRGAVYLPP